MIIELSDLYEAIIATVAILAMYLFYVLLKKKD